jgi:pyruvate ferredoxin oxidoreductase alpha subunit
MEVRSALANHGCGQQTQAFIVGLGGRDVRPVAITTAFDHLLADKHDTKVQWLDVREDAMSLRQYREAS